jgi:plasmid stabilization system protein ParE
MIINYEPKFINQFNNIWDFIAVDSKNRANKFKIELKGKIENLIYMPYKFRKSIYFEDENIRDLNYKGYVIPYEIDQKNDLINILGIKKYQNSI